MNYVGGQPVGTGIVDYVRSSASKFVLPNLHTGAYTKLVQKEMGKRQKPQHFVKIQNGLCPD